MSKLISLSYALAFALFGFSLSFAASELQDHDDIYSAVRIFAGDSEIQNIDPRLRLGKCSRPLAVRYPFSVESTVEVRCPTDEGWKIFLTLSPKAIATQLADSENDNNTTELKLGVVTTRRLQRGIAIRPGDLELQSFPSVQLKNAHFSDPREALGMEPNQTIPKGTLIANKSTRHSNISQGKWVHLASSCWRARWRLRSTIGHLTARKTSRFLIVPLGYPQRQEEVHPHRK